MTMSVSECSRLSNLKPVLINASDYSLGKDQSATHTHTHSSILGTEIDMEALEKRNEEDDVGERNVLMAKTTYPQCHSW